MFIGLAVGLGTGKTDKYSTLCYLSGVAWGKFWVNQNPIFRFFYSVSILLPIPNARITFTLRSATSLLLLLFATTTGRYEHLSSPRITPGRINRNSPTKRLKFDKDDEDAKLTSNYASAPFSATPTNETLMDPGDDALLEKSQHSPQISDGNEDEATPPPQPAQAKITSTFDDFIPSEVLTDSRTKTAKLAWKKENPKKNVKERKKRALETWNSRSILAASSSEGTMAATNTSEFNGTDLKNEGSSYI
ncbi:hypothetical protein BDN72DRAFT_940765 [Pluteus cervinus]|uniref:Uncharacterized protein n=1 Tax=Pluteus cervinus TaxID=181527 RepID=A0ACD3AX83_9AGAR|nr:hypothetical protein BDN72DRAFT_940765 [Pluteus cervinus]